MHATDRAVELSVVIPVKNEEDNVAHLAEEIGTCFAESDLHWEAVWVDDGSTDATGERLQDLTAPHRWLRLDRNHGQSAALLAGAGQARGTWIATLDGDGQNDPADLLRQLQHAREQGVDMVNGIRAKRQDSLVRRISSRLANWTRNRLTGETVRDVGCSTRVVRREVLLTLPFFHGMHRFLPTLVRMRGFRIAEIPVNHRPRERGTSKYGIHNRLWSGMRDIVGVRWLQSRARIWRVADSGGGEVVVPDRPPGDPGSVA